MSDLTPNAQFMLENILRAEKADIALRLLTGASYLSAADARYIADKLDEEITAMTESVSPEDIKELRKEVTEIEEARLDGIDLTDIFNDQSQRAAFVIPALMCQFIFNTKGAAAGAFATAYAGRTQAVLAADADAADYMSAFCDTLEAVATPSPPPKGTAFHVRR